MKKGHLLKGKKRSYAIESIIGSGSFCQVYLAIDQLTQQKYAIKQIQALDLDKRHNLEYLQEQEYNDNVLNTEEFILLPDDENTIFSVHEYCSEGNLYDFMSRRFEQMDNETKIAFCLQIAQGIQYLHKRKIIHRDLKPENLFVQSQQSSTSTGRSDSIHQKHQIKIGDFGISKILDQSQMVKSQVGSISYIPPECVNNADYSFSFDVWSYGCIAYEIFTNKQLFGATNFKEIKQKINNFNPSQLLLSTEFEQSEEITEVIKNCLHKQPEKRLKIYDIVNKMTNIFYKITNQNNEINQALLNSSIASSTSFSTFLSTSFQNTNINQLQSNLNMNNLNYQGLNNLQVNQTNVNETEISKLNTLIQAKEQSNNVNKDKNETQFIENNQKQQNTDSNLYEMIFNVKQISNTSQLSTGLSNQMDILDKFKIVDEQNIQIDQKLLLKSQQLLKTLSQQSDSITGNQKSKSNQGEQTQNGKDKLEEQKHNPFLKCQSQIVSSQEQIPNVNVKKTMSLCQNTQQDLQNINQIIFQRSNGEQQNNNLLNPTASTNNQLINNHQSHHSIENSNINTEEIGYFVNNQMNESYIREQNGKSEENLSKISTRCQTSEEYKQLTSSLIRCENKQLNNNFIDSDQNNNQLYDNNQQSQIQEQNDALNNDESIQSLIRSSIKSTISSQYQDNNQGCSQFQDNYNTEGIQSQISNQINSKIQSEMDSLLFSISSLNTCQQFGDTQFNDQTKSLITSRIQDSQTIIKSQIKPVNETNEFQEQPKKNDVSQIRQHQLNSRLNPIQSEFSQQFDRNNYNNTNLAKNEILPKSNGNLQEEEEIQMFIEQNKLYNQNLMKSQIHQENEYFTFCRLEYYMVLLHISTKFNNIKSMVIFNSGIKQEQLDSKDFNVSYCINFLMGQIILYHNASSEGIQLFENNPLKLFKTLLLKQTKNGALLDFIETLSNKSISSKSKVQALFEMSDQQKNLFSYIDGKSLISEIKVDEQERKEKLPINNHFQQLSINVIEQSKIIFNDYKSMISKSLSHSNYVVQNQVFIEHMLEILADDSSYSPPPNSKQDFVQKLSEFYLQQKQNTPTFYSQIYTS